MKSELHVVVGLVFNEKKEILIALRPPHVVQPGIWEFPGGKVEKNETLENALIREFREEVGIEITDATFFLKIEKYFPAKNLQLHLHTFRVLSFSGTPYGRENQTVRWVTIQSLRQYTFPEANADIILALENA
jgi:8-oxo-dGTP diphosphatase